MNLTPDQMASRAQSLLGDDLLQHVLAELVAEKTALFSGRTASEAAVNEARHAVWALEEITVRLQALVDNKLFAARRLAKAGPANVD